MPVLNELIEASKEKKFEALQVSIQKAKTLFLKA